MIDVFQVYSRVTVQQKQQCGRPDQQPQNSEFRGLRVQKVITVLRF